MESAATHAGTVGFSKVMDMRDFNWQVAVFFGSWAMLALCSFIFFQFNKNPALKKKVFVWGHLIADALFLGFVAWIGFPILAFVIAIPAVALITVVNYWGTKFCPHCGKTLVHAYRTRFCSRCGQPLTQTESERPDTT